MKRAGQKALNQVLLVLWWAKQTVIDGVEDDGGCGAPRYMKCSESGVFGMGVVRLIIRDIVEPSCGSEA